MCSPIVFTVETKNLSVDRKPTRAYKDGAYKDGPENIFCRTEILDGSDWTSQTTTKQKRQNWTSHAYLWPVLICAGPCREIFFF